MSYISIFMLGSKVTVWKGKGRVIREEVRTETRIGYSRTTIDSDLPQSVDGSNKQNLILW